MTTEFFLKHFPGGLTAKHSWDSALDEDYGSEHVHLCPEILYIIKGNLNHVIEDREYHLVKGDLVLIPPMRYHRLKLLPTTTEYERYNLLFPMELLNGISTDQIFRDIEVIHCSEHGIIADGFKKLDYYFEHLPEDAFHDVTVMFLRELFYNLSIYNGTNSSTPNVLSPMLTKALAYINENLFTIQSISEVSQSLFITDSYLFNVFKSQLKTSPKKYITLKRLLAAQNAIQLGKKPTEIYSDYGFSDYTSFYRSYVQHFGHSPSKEHPGKQNTL